MVTGVSLFSTSLPPLPGFKVLPASIRVTSTSSAPHCSVHTKGIYFWHYPAHLHSPNGAPRWKISLPNHAFQAANMADLDEDLRKLAWDVYCKQIAGTKRVHDEEIYEDEEGDDGDSSMFEDLDELLPAPVKRSGKAKSPAKSGPVNWPPAEVDVMCQNRYAVDWPEMRDYHCNYLSPVDKKTFNLKNHSKYLNIILSKPGIMQDVVFTVEQGRAYFAQTSKVSTNLYDRGVLTPLPASPGSKRFPDREVMAVIYTMGIVAHPSGQNIADDDPDSFGCMCLIELWDLHTVKALQ